MSKNKILVFGSSNTDMVVKTSKFPSLGETVLGGKILMNSGGKGANQVVAAQSLGGDVTFVGKTGNDIFGRHAVELLSEIVKTQYINDINGLCGNNDCGQMSAWYIFTNLGFYPVNPCGGEYVLGTP